MASIASLQWTQVQQCSLPFKTSTADWFTYNCTLRWTWKAGEGTFCSPMFFHTQRNLSVETLRCRGVSVLDKFIILYVPIVLEADPHYFSLCRTVVRVGHFYLEQRSDYSHIRSPALTFNCPSRGWYRSGETFNTSQMCQNCPRKCAKLLTR